jgi:aminoglycoside phosphotransferase (APT) family kinase protein
VQEATMIEPWEQDVPVEVAPVRPGEDLAWDRLEAYLRPVLQIPEDVPEMTVLQFPNGSANLTYLLAFGDRRVVLRRPPFGVIAPGAHDMTREHRVLSRLWQQYDRAPRAFVLCQDHDVVGADFVISEYRSGEVIWASLPPSMADLPDAAQRVGSATVDALADLHLACPTACGLGDLGRPDGFLERQLSGWRKRWEFVATPEHAPAMEAAGGELARRRPGSSRGTFLHNDFKLDNCQFTPGQPDRVTSVFDWDMATLGDPLVDFGTLLNYWPDPADTPDDRALHVPGMEHLGLPPRNAVVGRYAERTGFDVTDVYWYEAFACWRVAIICQQLYQRFVRGESTDERMASRGDNVGMLANRARRILADRGRH